MSRNLSMANRLLRIEAGIRGVLNTPEIQSKMATFGYTEEAIKQGEQKLDRVKALTSTQVEEYSDQYAATGSLSKKWAEAYSTYMITLKVVRVAFKGAGEMLARFKASGQRRRTLSGWLMDANVFYANLLDTPEALERMNQFGYSSERIELEFNAVKEVETLYSQKLIEKGAAQHSTVERNNALEDLCNWYSDFRAIARIALYDTPQLLETLGIVKK